MSTTECDREQGTTMKRKYWLITLVVLWVGAVISVGLVPWQRDFDWSSFASPGLILVGALVITVAWWKSKDDKTD